MRAVLTDFGATTVSLFVNDKNGKSLDIIAGYDEVLPYQKETCYFGATVGRNANRISDAKITVDGIEYKLDANDNENNLHSGSTGTSELFWQVKEHKENSITFEYLSRDLEQGFPGNATMTVTYTLTDNNDFEMVYHGISDKKTVFNMTNHNYYNLNGHTSGTICNHTLQISASHYNPVKSAKAIPTGEIAPVEGTPFDFRTAKTIGQNISDQFDQLTYGNGYDHNFAIDKTGTGLEKIATAIGDKSGIQMDVLTDCVGIQLYTGNFIGGQVGKGGHTYADRDAFCLETQFYPNSINEPNFASPLVDANKDYNSKTVYHFSIA